jgi:hypothetical protein
VEWHILTGEYPPKPGGVADYTALLARALVAAGHVAHVWCPGNAAGPVGEPGGAIVHRMAGRRFGLAGLARLDRENPGEEPFYSSCPNVSGGGATWLPGHAALQMAPGLFGWQFVIVGEPFSERNI